MNFANIGLMSATVLPFFWGPLLYKIKRMTTTKNKIAFITGGSRGLGRDMAISIAKKGIDIVLTYNNNQQKAAEVVAEIQTLGQNAKAFALNTGKIDSFDDFFKTLSAYLEEQYGSAHFDFLVNNAGAALYAPFATTTEAQFDQALDVHFKGVFFLTQKSLPFLNNGGGIINISSGLARFSNPGSSTYASMKGAVEILTKYLAKELGSRGIRANIVAPGAIETDFGDGHVRDNKDLNNQIASLTALGRVGLPEDIGGVVAFLCTEDARWVNGQRIEVSGGVNL